jgi:acyl-CoA synthetase (AMP-forming)/AMP-acid ligase II
LTYDAESTAAVLAEDGWLTTGDFGFLDDNGYLHLVGRANELYIRGGYNVYPAEVEGVLGRHPAVGQVAVVGSPDPVLGEIGVAFVVPVAGGQSDEEALLAELRATACASLADYKAPDRVVVADSLPLTSMMKVDKRFLAERAASLPPTGHGPTGPRPRPRPRATGPVDERSKQTNGASAS